MDMIRDVTYIRDVIRDVAAYNRDVIRDIAGPERGPRGRCHAMGRARSAAGRDRGRDTRRDRGRDKK